MQWEQLPKGTSPIPLGCEGKHKADKRLPNGKFQDKQATETPNKALNIESFRLQKTSEIKSNH